MLEAAERKRPILGSSSTRIKRVGIKDNRPLFVDDYEEICFNLAGLSHHDSLSRPFANVDTILNMMSSLAVQTIAHDWDKPIDDLLNLTWWEVLPELFVRKTSTDRAIKLCVLCGLSDFRDILWYNNSLQRGVTLQRFPICLIEMAYELRDWAPRRSAPSISLDIWTAAWQALRVIWHEVVTHMPPKLVKRLLKQKFDMPPNTVNWFEFTYCDGILDVMVPVLCYHDPTEPPLEVNGVKLVSQATSNQSAIKDAEKFDTALATLELEITRLLLAERNKDAAGSDT